jgi:hypothetical protein
MRPSLLRFFDNFISYHSLLMGNEKAEFTIAPQHALFRAIALLMAKVLPLCRFSRSNRV